MVKMNAYHPGKQQKQITRGIFEDVGLQSGGLDATLFSSLAVFVMFARSFPAKHSTDGRDLLVPCIRLLAVNLLVCRAT